MSRACISEAESSPFVCHSIERGSGANVQRLVDTPKVVIWPEKNHLLRQESAEDCVKSSEMLQVGIGGDQFLRAENVSPALRLPDHLEREKFRRRG